MEFQISSYLQKPINSFAKEAKENHLQVVDANGNGIFDDDDSVYYEVQKGDSFSKISRKYAGGNMAEMKKANSSRADFDKIRLGEKVAIPFVFAEKTSTTKQTAKVTQAKNKEKADKQFTIMLDAGHGSGKYLSANQQILIPGQTKPYVTKKGDSLESIAKAKNVDVAQLKSANKNMKYSRDPGAVKNNAKYDEADITGVAVQRLKKQLEEKGYTVLINERTDKANLKDRQKFKLEQKPNVFISLHCDSDASGKATGETVLYNSSTPEDKKFATMLNERLKKNSTFKNRAMQERNKLCVLRGDKKGEIAEALVELGFISNSSDYSKLTDMSQLDIQLKAIVDGVEDYYQA